MSPAASSAAWRISACGCQIGHSFSQTFGARHHMPHGLGCAMGLPSVMVYTAKYGERRNLEEVAEAMGVACTAETGTMELGGDAGAARGWADERTTDQIAARIRLLAGGLPGFAEQFAHDGAFGNAPGAPSMEEIRGIHLLYLCGVLMENGGRPAQRAQPPCDREIAAASLLKKPVFYSQNKTPVCVEG